MWQLRKTFAPEKYSIEEETPFTRLNDLTKELDSFNREFDTTFGFGGSTFPPYDEYTKDVNGEKHIFFVFAIAGLSKDNLKVSFDDDTNTLKVTYKRPETEDATRKYTHRGIAQRSFEFTRTLKKTDSTYEIVRASTAIQSGCLVIEFKENEKLVSDKYITVE